ncbi:MAG: endonuclease/exonuclease/phosphatase family protein [Alphaproteobacteria bacterium]|nr:endonuclease/exonuclease/phosphatase family protein [Alphaproteobacteria bacterium]
MRVVTWNVHGFVGSDGRSDLERTGRALQSLRPDIAALQEVDSRASADGGRDAFKLLQSCVGPYAVKTTTIANAGREYGHMVASRHPLLTSAVHDISIPDREARRVIDCTLDTVIGPLRVLGVHLGFRGAERRAQLRALKDIAGHRHSTPTLILGDFNVWNRRSKWAAPLVESFAAIATPATFPSRLPILPLDRVLSRPPELIVETQVVPELRGISDHLPVVAVLRR